MKTMSLKEVSVNKFKGEFYGTIKDNGYER